ncbi:pantoate--beta-alanine ligase [Mangrovivirga cuniculi]|uniref:Pantothenate synthetase n=1 Tax=Mangrovivirga cuniculi TaxID=2715131 RepID=A0A4D7JQA8_9BACT|nr:pantoate--beta-alanine ligase [Mangrovivirga cuniculi]QCK13676.1 pantoate--beta-alanine ligase [Mangrovivirga cuniculi]
MKVFSSIETYSRWWMAQPKNQTLGFVPTMGALHQGHVSLIKESKKHSDLTVASIFVNPTQFNDPNDLLKYPRTPEEDIEALKEAGCDILFMPSSEEVYNNRYNVSIDPGPSAEILEGSFRPGHFKGVLQIVSKLFNIIRPDIALFGKKDLQQLQLIKKMVLSLNYHIDIIGVNTVREKTGLAMSSRNVRLDSNERDEALQLYKNLKIASQMWEKGEELAKIKSAVKENFGNFGSLKLEYFEAVEPEAFEIVNSREDLKSQVAFCVAAYVGDVRLIDNIVIDN